MNKGIKNQIIVKIIVGLMNKKRVNKIFYSQNNNINKLKNRMTFLKYKNFLKNKMNFFNK